jgi:hypothetical protein
MTNTDQEAYSELSYYTLAHGDPSFIHQHVVDVFAAQTADEKVKPIKLTFALVGLFLYVEMQFDGRRVQWVHMKLAQEKQPWPAFSMPTMRGEVTVHDVMAARPGLERDEMIRRWCETVWNAYRDNRQVVADLLRQHNII